MGYFRAIAIILTQLPILLFYGGSHDLLFGFNQTDKGFSLMIGLFVIVPLVNLVWLSIETRKTFKKTREVGFNKALPLPFVALFVFLESLAIDYFLLTQLRM
jgi:hypothetical protein